MHSLLSYNITWTILCIQPTTGKLRFSSGDHYRTKQFRTAPLLYCNNRRKTVDGGGSRQLWHSMGPYVQGWMSTGWKWLRSLRSTSTHTNSAAHFARLQPFDSNQIEFERLASLVTLILLKLSMRKLVLLFVIHNRIDFYEISHTDRLPGLRYRLLFPGMTQTKPWADTCTI